MGNTIWILSEGQDSDDCDHKMLLKYEKVFNEICKNKRLVLFSELLDHSILEQEYLDTPGAPKYIEPTQAMTILSKIQNELIMDSSRINSNDLEELISEIEDCLMKLRKANQKGQMVCLGIIP